MRPRLEADLREAMKARDKPAVAALRTLIAAIDNAGAVEPGPAWPPVVGRRADVPRKELTPQDVEAILVREEKELRKALAEYERLGRIVEAGELRAKLEVVNRYVGRTGSAERN
jgi:uncharacterized protein YqeY